MKINLVNNGIFPIVFDKDGNKLAEIPDTGFLTSGTIQGEGKLIGMPCLFIRTSACNLRCAWIGADGKGSPCDTPYSSHKPEKNHMEIEEVIALVKANLGNIKYVVVSGGEPTMQKEALGELLKQLRELNLHTTIETNATIYDDKIAQFTNLFSMSPKLSSSTPWEANLKDTGIEFNKTWAERHERDRKNIEVIQAYIDACYMLDLSNEKRIELQTQLGEFPKELNETQEEFNIRKTQVIVAFHKEHGFANYSLRRIRDFQLKFVVTKPEDVEEIEKDFLANLKGWWPQDICLMPEGITPEDLMQRSSWAVQECVKKGYRFTPRLHAMLFGIKRGV